MSGADVQDWLDRYLTAWESNDPAAVGELFTDDATYAFHPYDDPVRGRDAIVAAWLATKDEPGSWRAALEPTMVDGDRAVITGTTWYADGITYANLWVLRLAPDGRCSDFVEWFMEYPA